MSKSDGRGHTDERVCTRKVRAPQGKGAGEMPVEATLRKVQQKITADFVSKGEKVR